MDVVVLALAIFYSLLILSALTGWVRTPVTGRGQEGRKEHVSVIIPARNEELNIGVLLADLRLQTYPEELFEVIVVNDGSDDDTASVAEQAGLRNSKLIHLQNAKGKKASIDFGISNASGSVMLTTDADCRVPATWLESMVAALQEPNTKMVLGPVVLSKPKGFLRGFQSLENLGLMLFTCGFAKWGAPFLANGANLAYRKIDYQNAGGYEGNLHVSSGDDLFLMEQFKATFGNKSIAFAKARQAVIRTKPTDDWQSLLHQRLRWLSKTKHMKSVTGAVVMSTAIVVNMLVAAGMIAALLHPNVSIALALIAVGVKTGADFAGLLVASLYFKRLRTLIWFPLSQVFYPLYVLILATLMWNGLPVKWKGRPVTT